MPNLSIKEVPEALAEKLRQRAARNHRSLQGELMSIIELAVAEAAPPPYYGEGEPRRPAPAGAEAEGDDLLARLQAIVGSQGIDTRQRLTRDEAHDRAALRQSGI